MVDDVWWNDLKGTGVVVFGSVGVGRRILLGASARPECVFEAELSRDLRSPAFTTEGLAANDAAANCLQFRFSLRLIDVVGPKPSEGHRSRRQQSPLFESSLRPAVKAAPAPSFRLADEFRTEGVAFDVPHHGQVMRIRGNREGLEASLVDMSHPCGAVMGVPALGVRDSEPAKELGDLVVFALSRPDDEVPVIAQEHVSQDSERHAFTGLCQNLLEGGKIRILLEQAEPAIRPIEHMVHITADNRSRTSGHSVNLPPSTIPVNRNDSRPLYFTQLILEGTIGQKGLQSPQLVDFVAFSGGYTVIIIRPTVAPGFSK